MKLVNPAFVDTHGIVYEFGLAGSDDLNIIPHVLFVFPISHRVLVPQPQFIDSVLGSSAGRREMRQHQAFELRVRCLPHPEAARRERVDIARSIEVLHRSSREHEHAELD